MAVETVRIDEHGREQLIWLKRHTRIDTFNVLCRWALCASLAETTRPPDRTFKGDAVEIAWRVFGGGMSEVYWSILKVRCRADGIEATPANMQEQLRLHIHRGLGYLAGDKELRSIAALASRVNKATKERSREKF